MVKLRIMGINKSSEFLLLNENDNKMYSLMLEFYKMKSPKINDYLTIDERLLNPKYEGFTQPYAFTTMAKNEVKKIAKIDVVLLSSSNSDIILKRIYG